MDADFASLISLVEHLNSLPTDHASKVLDLTQRRDLRKKLRKLNLALEDPGEIVDRIIYSVRLLISRPFCPVIHFRILSLILHQQPADAVTTCIAVELNLFSILVQSDKPKTSRELAESTGADATLLARILRYLAGIDAIGTAGPDLYTATKVSKAFTTTKGIGGSGLL